MFETILVLLDGSSKGEEAVPVADAEARAHNATLVLLRVVAYAEAPAAIPSHGRRPWTEPPADDVRVAAEDVAARYLAGVRERFQLGSRVETVVRCGDPYGRIVEEIRHHPRALVVMTSQSTAARPISHYSEIARRLLSSGAATILAVSPGAH